MILSILCVIAIIYTWNCWSKIQANSGLIIFTALGDYFIYKLILCMLTFWFVTPIGIVIQVIKYIANRN